MAGTVLTKAQQAAIREMIEEVLSSVGAGKPRKKAASKPEIVCKPTINTAEYHRLKEALRVVVGGYIDHRLAEGDERLKQIVSSKSNPIWRSTRKNKPAMPVLSTFVYMARDLLEVDPADLLWAILRADDILAKGRKLKQEDIDEIVDSLTTGGSSSD